MSDGFTQSDEQFILEQRARQKKAGRRKKKALEEPGGLGMNSLMDIMVIILVFLLKNYGDEPIKVIGEDLKAPESATQLTPEDMTTITVSQKAILVNNTKTVDVKQGAVDKSMKKGGEASLLIQPLFEGLQEEIAKKKREMRVLGQTYEPTATIIADQSTPFRLVTEVMYTAGQAELNQFKFAVVKVNRDSFGGAE
ncbi:hypothetical protein FRD01_17835 [Microvenator marinus]|jgi:biopolymer transport protein ExbD|uniref:Biopolymer transporter ExbD n=1 Tax=Microvenator marinus TaxID=2600177 RepID=A0A5B8XU19_9DELT|nr:biopolymer transporter ExbD [Microvenator marinus]QED29065.1 hypothetical protein FRD01_17835 [Microvenator marinus]